MKRFLILGAVVAGLSLTGLTGAADAGYGPVRSGNGAYGWNSGCGGYNGYGAYNGYGSNRNCWGGYRNRAPISHCSPRPYGYGNSYGVLGNFRSGYGCNW